MAAEIAYKALGKGSFHIGKEREAPTHQAELTELGTEPGDFHNTLGRYFGTGTYTQLFHPLANSHHVKNPAVPYPGAARDPE